MKWWQSLWTRCHGARNCPGLLLRGYQRVAQALRQQMSRVTLKHSNTGNEGLGVGFRFVGKMDGWNTCFLLGMVYFQGLLKLLLLVLGSASLYASAWCCFFVEIFESLKQKLETGGHGVLWIPRLGDASPLAVTDANAGAMEWKLGNFMGQLGEI